MRTVYDNLSLAGIVAPVFVTTSAATSTADSIVITGAVADTRGFNSAALRVQTTAITGVPATIAASLVAVLQECATSNGSFTTALDNTGTAIGFTQSVSTAVVLGSARIEGLGLQRLRFLRVQLTGKVVGAASTSLNAFTTFAVIEMGRAYNNPVLPATVSNT